MCLLKVRRLDFFDAAIWRAGRRRKFDTECDNVFLTFRVKEDGSSLIVVQITEVPCANRWQGLRS